MLCPHPKDAGDSRTLVVASLILSNVSLYLFTLGVKLK